MMLKETEHKISLDLLLEAQKCVEIFDGKTILNTPTGRFFYDNWNIKDEFKNTVWEKILDTLPYQIGEARLIKLNEHSCYSSHGDIDDRWHLNVSGDKSYLVDLSSLKMYPQTQDLTWWNMNAGPIHSAVNFGNEPRYQLVVRHLLLDNILKEPIQVCIYVDEYNRYEFDEKFSPWLNFANKQGIISNFDYRNFNVSFLVEKEFLNQVIGLSTDQVVARISDDA